MLLKIYSYMWQRNLKKLRTLKKISKCVKFGTKSTHFENFFKVRYIWDQLENFFQSVLRMYINFPFDVDF